MEDMEFLKVMLAEMNANMKTDKEETLARTESKMDSIKSKNKYWPK
jgi:hypothetical protein